MNDTATKMTAEELDKLEALAKAATPGPWASGWPGIPFEDAVSRIYDEDCHTKEDAAFIAAANPATVLALIAQARAAAPAPHAGNLVLDRYDAGLLSDFGGGNIEWWQDYLRAELDRAHDFYQAQADGVALSQQPAQAARGDASAYQALHAFNKAINDGQSHFEAMHAALATQQAEAEPVAPAILEALSWHGGERDDLTLEEAVEAIRNGWKKVRGRRLRAMLLQLASLMAGAPVAQHAAPVIWYDANAPVADKALPPEATEKKAKLSLSLRADSGYMADETHRISAEQWGRICEIVNEKG